MPSVQEAMPLTIKFAAEHYIGGVSGQRPGCLVLTRVRAGVQLWKYCRMLDAGCGAIHSPCRPSGTDIPVVDVRRLVTDLSGGIADSVPG